MKRIALAAIVGMLAATAESAYAWCYYDRADLKAPCNCRTSPAKEMRKSEKDNISYTVEHEVKDDNGKTLSLVLFQEYPPIDTFMLHSQGGLVETHWFTIRTVCESTRKDALASDLAHEKERADAANKRLSPYE